MPVAKGPGGPRAFALSCAYGCPIRSQGLRQDLPKQNGPTDQGIATVADARFDGQVEITGFVDEAAHFAGRLGDVDQQHVPATGNVIGGHEGLLLVVRGPAR